MVNYDLPVCKSFKPKVRNLQLCYEVDLEKYKNRNNIVKDLKSGLVFFMDYNEDRQIILDENEKVVYQDNFVDKVDASKDEESAFIYLNTIGKKNVILNLLIFFIFRICEVNWGRKIQPECNKGDQSDRFLSGTGH